MKEPLTIAANFLSLFTEEGVTLPQIEICLVLREPVYSVDSAGEVVRSSGVSHVRFVGSPRAINKLGEEMINFAKERSTLDAGKAAK